MRRLDLNFLGLAAALIALGCDSTSTQAELPDGSAICKPGELNCGGMCANLDESPLHCGVCDNACEAPEGAEPICVEGICDFQCLPDGDEDAGEPLIEKSQCDDACYDLLVDLSHCGDCGNACGEPKNGDVSCEEGACEVECDPGHEQCDEDCFNLLVDDKHCGDCDTSCSKNEVCAGGRCVLSCPEGAARCGNSCVDISKDADHCGGCGNECPDAGKSGDPVCESGQCGIECDKGLENCNGVCVDTDDDVNNCGACDAQCSSVNGDPACKAGKCKIDCDKGFENCDNNTKNGCEADLSSEQTCGDCGTSCGGGKPFCDPSAGPSCSDMCALTECKSPDRCVDTTMDVNDCGACGETCGDPQSGAATGDPLCDKSKCDVECRAPTDNKVSLGSSVGCVDTDSDPRACGGSEKACAKGEKCSGGSCAKDGCAPGQTKTADGCVNLDTDGSNCGTPDNACTGTIASGTCVAGTCWCRDGDCESSCSSTKCDRDCVDTDDDPSHCGACDNACAAGEYCKAGACREFIYASGGWQCGEDNAFDKVCSLGGDTVCVKSGVACP